MFIVKNFYRGTTHGVPDRKLRRGITLEYPLEVTIEISSMAGDAALGLIKIVFGGAGLVKVS